MKVRTLTPALASSVVHSTLCGVAYERRVFSANLRVALGEADKTQEQLARDVGVTLGAVSAWCRELSEPKGRQLLLIAEALGRPASWFFTDHAPEDVAA